MKKRSICISVYALLGFLLSCYGTSSRSVLSQDSVESKLKHAEKQLTLLLAKSEKADAIPRTTKDGVIHWTNPEFDWTEGFFPGSCWLLYEATKEDKWKQRAEHFQSKFEAHKYLTTNHDLGFVFNSSFGNGYKLTGNEQFKEIMITAGNSLITRFHPKIGAIRSWDIDKGWQSERGWKFPVIIDNMMNLELLFKLSEFTGDTKYKDIAIVHANTTLTNHFREDFSSYHVIDYDPDTGNVRLKQTAQGYSNESSWARGQAWGLYGYTVCYRYTNDKKYLRHAENIADFIIKNNKISDDGIPYWDYDAPNIPDEPRDVSAAAIAVSALLELDEYSTKNYSPYIHKTISCLSSPEYLAEIGKNNLFLLKHAVGSIPHGVEIDVPLNYADYYYLEALMRLNSTLIKD